MPARWSQIRIPVPSTIGTIATCRKSMRSSRDSPGGSERGRRRPVLSAAHNLRAYALTPHAEQGPINGHGFVDSMNAVDDTAVESGEERLSAANRVIERHMITRRKSVGRDKQVVDRVRGMAAAPKVIAKRDDRPYQCRRGRGAARVEAASCPNTTGATAQRPSVGRGHPRSPCDTTRDRGPVATRTADTSARMPPSSRMPCRY